ncbi:hypothetical protein Ddc_15523 [Ditylenchus destructor]|nr:hypothetical protein Ddc_15523 [Ditylenchus destructor]
METLLAGLPKPRTPELLLESSKPRVTNLYVISAATASTAANSESSRDWNRPTQTDLEVRTLHLYNLSLCQCPRLRGRRPVPGGIRSWMSYSAQMGPGIGSRI